MRGKTVRAAGACIALVILLASAAATARADGSPSLPAPSLRIGPAPAPPQVGAQRFSTNNYDTGVCLTGPGVACYADFLMSKGVASAIFYFSDGTDVQGGKACYQATCSLQVIGFPNSPYREVVSVYISGPNISIFATGPYFG